VGGLLGFGTVRRMTCKDTTNAGAYIFKAEDGIVIFAHKKPSNSAIIYIKNGELFVTNLGSGDGYQKFSIASINNYLHVSNSGWGVGHFTAYFFGV
jgi:hypothetical protein